MIFCLDSIVSSIKFSFFFFYLYYEFSLTYILYPFPSPLFFTDHFLSPFLPLYLGDRLSWLPVLLRASDRCLSLYTASTLPQQEYSTLFLRYYSLFYCLFCFSVFFSDWLITTRSVNKMLPYSFAAFLSPFIYCKLF